MHTDAHHREYEILAHVGRGGFGDVYYARMRGPRGFVQDVAIKILREDQISPLDLARFRDEARILGLLHDRAVVHASPPTLLSGRWAVVMEFVDGATAGQLVKRSLFPPRAALELVAEVARVLHKAHYAPGPDGRPLHLVHRDLKPGNLQITVEGHLKLLDFGVARADFSSREALTTSRLGGTPGFIAPERLRGQDGPAGDIFSLGVLLQVLLTRQPAIEVDATEPNVPADPWVVRLVNYSRSLRATNPTHRPTAAEVEAQCRAWLGEATGLDLAAFAAEHVPDARPRQDGELVGSVLTETLDISTTRDRRLSPRQGRPPAWLIASFIASAFLTVGLGAAGLGFALIATWAPTQGGVEVAAPPAPAPRAEVLPPAEVVDPTPGRATPRTVPTPKTQTSGGAATAPAPLPAQASKPTQAVSPAPDRVPVRPMEAVTFLSEPPGAEVLVDGVPIGTTPVRGHPLDPGSHTVTFRREGQAPLTQEVRVGGRHGQREFKWTDSGVVAR